MIKFAVALVLALPGIVLAAGVADPTVVLTLKNHRYEPAARW